MNKPSPLEEIVARALAHWLRESKASQDNKSNVPKSKHKHLK